MENNTGVIWCRVSSERQTHGYSQEAQMRILEEAAEKRGIQVEECHKYNVHESAKDSERRRYFKQMVKAIKEDGIGNLLAFSTDRITRNPNDYGTINQLIEDGVTVILVDENRTINKTSSPGDRFVFGILANAAHLFNLQNSVKTRSGMEQKVRKGGYPRGAPVGYRPIADPSDPFGIKRSVDKDPERAPLVKKAFELYATGDYTLESLRVEMKRRGLTSRPGRRRPGGPISRHGIEVILHDRFYYGEFLWSQQIWKGSHEPLISKELFDNVQVKLKRNIKNPRDYKKKDFPFKRFLRCGYCKSSITGELQKNHNYYHCTRGQNKDGYRCPQGYFRQEKIEEMFIQALGDLYVDDHIAGLIRTCLLDSYDEREAEEKRELVRLQKEYADNRKKVRTAYRDNRLDGTFTLAEFRELKDELDAECEIIKKNIKKLDNYNSDYKEQGSTILELLKGFKSTYLKQDLEGRLLILDIVLDKCILRGKNGEDSFFLWREPFNILFTVSELLKGSEKAVIKKSKWGE